MSGSVNKVMLLGNVCADPDIRLTHAGKAIANMRIATNESWKDKQTGERREKAEFHTVVCFNENLTKVVEAYVKKGSKIFVSGSLQTRKWTDQQGVEKYSTEVVLQAFNGELVLLDSKGSDERGSSPYPEVGSERDPNAPPRQSISERAAPGGPVPAARDLDDEIPFAPQVL